MNTEFNSNSFENDYILSVLNMLVLDLKTSKKEGEVIDKTACILTAFMNGQIIATVNKLKEI